MGQLNLHTADMTKPTTPQKTSASQSGIRTMPVLNRAAELVPASFNETDNTVDVVWTTGASVRRYDWYSETTYEEELAVTPEAVDMSRFDAGTVQVLDGHNVYGGVKSIIGIAIRGSIENGEGRATLRLSTRPEMAGIVADIKAGIIRAISFGYSVTKYEITRAIDRTDGVNMPLYRAVAWQPYEISFVTVPADADASTREQPSTGVPCEFITRAPAHSSLSPTQETQMPTAENQSGAAAPNAADHTRAAAPVAAPAAAPAAADTAAATQAATDAATRAADITEMCTRHGVGQLAAGLIRGGNSVDQARALIEETGKEPVSDPESLRGRIPFD